MERGGDGDGLVETGVEAGGDGGDAFKEEAPAEGFVHERDGDAAVEDAGPAGVLRAGDVGGDGGEGTVGAEEEAEAEGVLRAADEAVGGGGGVEGGGGDGGVGHGARVGEVGGLSRGGDAGRRCFGGWL